MILITRKELFIALRRMYETNCVDGVVVQLLQDEPLNKYAEMVADVQWRADLHRLQANWTIIDGAAQHWNNEAKIDLDIVCRDCAMVKAVILKYVPQEYEDSPLADPVARWLAETLRPRSIHWSGDDPITDVLRAVLINGSAYSSERVAARTAKRLLELIQQPARPPSAFFEAVARLRHSELRSVQFSTLLRELFGESLRLRPVRGGLAYGGKVALVRIDPRVNSWSMVMWATTGEPVICDMAQRRSSFDFANFENMQHLYKCYNAHNKQTGDNLLCSHSTSRKD